MFFFVSTLTILFFNYPFFHILFLYIPFLYSIPRLICHSFTFIYIFFVRLPSCPLSFLFRFSLLQFYSVASIFFVSYNSFILISVLYCLKSWSSLQTTALKPLLPIFREERVKLLLSEM